MQRPIAAKIQFPSSFRLRARGAAVLRLRRSSMKRCRAYCRTLARILLLLNIKAQQGRTRKKEQPICSNDVPDMCETSRPLGLSWLAFGMLTCSRCFYGHSGRTRPDGLGVLHAQVDTLKWKEGVEKKGRGDADVGEMFGRRPSFTASGRERA